MLTKIKVRGIVLLLILFISDFIKAQENQTSQSSKLFSEGRFEEALPLFKEMLKQSPENEKLNYFVGVCLIETKNFSPEALKLLEIAKSKIPESLFYIGKYHHAQSGWDIAAQYYEQFKLTAPVRSVQGSPVEELLVLCQQKTNPFVKAVVQTVNEAPAQQVVPVVSPVLSPATPQTTIVQQVAVPVQQPPVIQNQQTQMLIVQQQPDSTRQSPSIQQPVQAQSPVSLPQPQVRVVQAVVQSPSQQSGFNPNIPPELRDTLISFQVNAMVNYNYIDQFRFESSRNIFIQGWQTEKELNAKLEELNTLREQYAVLIGPEQETLTTKILKLEQETMLLHQQVQETYQKANVQEAGYWNKANALEVHNFRQRTEHAQDSIVNAKAMQRMILAEIQLPVVIIPDTIAADTSVVVPVSTGPSNIIYKVLIGAYKSAPPQWIQDLFKKLSVLRKIDKNVDESGITIYTVGELTSYDDANLLKEQIRQEGIKTATVAAFLNGKRISMEKVKELLSK